MVRLIEVSLVRQGCMRRMSTYGKYRVFEPVSFLCAKGMGHIVRVVQSAFLLYSLIYGLYAEEVLVVASRYAFKVHNEFLLIETLSEAHLGHVLLNTLYVL
jgi:hypothetical protein